MPPPAATGLAESPLLGFVQTHPRLLVLTGAGISTDSGIPDYRDADGQWKHRPPVQLRDFLGSEAVRRRYVVFFGEAIPRPRVERAMARLAEADALLVVGSSLMVFSGYRFCRAAAEQGKPIAAVNLGRTRADDLLSLKIRETCAAALVRLARDLGL